MDYRIVETNYGEAAAIDYVERTCKRLANGPLVGDPATGGGRRIGRAATGGRHAHLEKATHRREGMRM
jgi:hypothetical protein